MTETEFNEDRGLMRRMSSASPDDIASRWSGFGTPVLMRLNTLCSPHGSYRLAFEDKERVDMNEKGVAIASNRENIIRRLHGVSGTRFPVNPLVLSRLNAPS